MATKYFLKDTNTDTTCDSTGPRDMSKTQGTPTTATTNTTASETYEVVATYDINVSGDSPGDGTHSVSVDMASITSAFNWRFRIQAVSVACVVLTSSAYSSDFTTAGIKTESLSLTWGVADRLRLSIEGFRTSGQHGNHSGTLNVNDADSFVDAPWTVTTPASDVPINPVNRNTLLRM